MVVTEDPCGDAGRGRGLHQIVAIGAKGGRQFIEPVAGMTSSGVRHVMRDDERRPVCRLGELPEEPSPREPMLSQGIDRGEKARALAAADQAMVVDFSFG